ncbi:hypothetical protein YC2023_021091 [Brassica napus]
MIKSKLKQSFRKNRKLHLVTGFVVSDVRNPASVRLRVREEESEEETKVLRVARGRERTRKESENAEPGVSEISALENFTGPVVHTNGSAYISGLEFANLKVLVVGCRYSGIKMCLNLCTYNDLPHMVVRNSASEDLKPDQFSLRTPPEKLRFLISEQSLDGKEIEFESIIFATGCKSSAPDWLKYMEIKDKIHASAGSRTRVYCLEGNYPNRWTTDACDLSV